MTNQIQGPATPLEVGTICFVAVLEPSFVKKAWSKQAILKDEH
jgi:hypothetical protein